MTNWFEQYYPELLDYASAIIYKHNLPALPGDLVNDAFLKLVDSGKEFDLKEAKRLVSGSYYEEDNYRKSKTSSSGGYSKKQPRITGEKSCTKCGEAKNVNEFRYKKNLGYSYVENVCNKCRFKMQLRWFTKNKEKWAAYMMKRHRAKGGISRAEYNEKRTLNKKPIHELWKKANKKRYKKEKDLLLDSYIRRLLKAGKKPFTPKEIEKKRQELVNKRREAAASLNNLRS